MEGTLNAQIAEELGSWGGKRSLPSTGGAPESRRRLGRGDSKWEGAGQRRRPPERGAREAEGVTEGGRGVSRSEVRGRREGDRMWVSLGKGLGCRRCN